MGRPGFIYILFPHSPLLGQGVGIVPSNGWWRQADRVAKGHCRPAAPTLTPGGQGGRGPLQTCSSHTHPTQLRASVMGLICSLGYCTSVPVSQVPTALAVLPISPVHLSFYSP